jgi:hypothetical protein
MEPLKYRDRHLGLNSHGYTYLHIPKPIAEALGSRWVDLIITDSGLLVVPIDERPQQRR